MEAGWSADGEDEAVQATNTDACMCKASAVARGYYKDDYIAYFARRAERKPPEIHRGYFARVRAIDIFVHHFLERCGSQCQIVNLGCGFDTLFWRLGDSTRAFGNFVELDHAGVVAKKINIIRRTPALASRVQPADGGGGGAGGAGGRGALHGARYHLSAADLRSVPAVRAALAASGALPARPPPTLVLAECVLVYLPAAAAAALLRALAEWFPTGMVVLYEQCNLDDRFGEVMVSNLAARGCSLGGAPDPAAAAGRLRAAGWARAAAWDMGRVWRALAPPERARAESLEPLDERELLVQLHAHYALAVAAQGELLADLDLAAPLETLLDRA